MNVLPSPGVLTRWISPPSRRAISREIDRPSPVPPYVRSTDPSACWNASKMTRCLSGSIPTPVSRTENATTRRPAQASVRHRVAGWRDAEHDAPSRVN